MVNMCPLINDQLSVYCLDNGKTGILPTKFHVFEMFDAKKVNPSYSNFDMAFWKIWAEKK